MTPLRERIEAAFDKKSELTAEEFAEFMRWLNDGTVRAAMPVDDGWQVQSWVKKGILLGFRSGVMQDFSENGPLLFFDKHTFPLKPLTLQDGVRVVPGGSSVRSGSYVAKGVVIMPPAYINVGAYVDADSMIDSHSLVGSCAQIGKRVHLSAGAQIGGVLEPVGSQPVIIEDDVLVGGNCGVYEGTRVCRGAVLGAGTILTRSIPVYDLVHHTVLRGSADAPLTIPERAVVVAGSRPITSNDFARQEQLHLQCGLIIKYRDANTDRATALESALR